MNSSETMLCRVEDYLKLRRQLGYRLLRQGYLLLEFGRYADGVGHRGPITNDLALRWVRLPSKATLNYLANRLHVVRRFARHLAIEDPSTEIPTDHSLRLRRISPHIYSSQQVSELMNSAAELSPTGGLRPQTYRTLFGLLISTGIRVGEAIRLHRDDVDLKEGVLKIIGSKSKSRLVPVHPSTREALCRYAKFRDRYYPSSKSKSFFLAESGLTLKYDAVNDAFTKIRRDLKWPLTNSGRAIRIHDLRHTFACQRLLNWHRDGVDLDHAAYALSTYLGHVTVASTYWYLTGTPELLSICANRFQQFAETGQGGEA